ncbi:MAG TPA: hypothetical protein VGO93_25855 [Candidatus Xenobia bacterium]
MADPPVAVPAIPIQGEATRQHARTTPIWTTRVEVGSGSSTPVPSAPQGPSLQG